MGGGCVGAHPRGGGWQGVLAPVAPVCVCAEPPGKVPKKSPRKPESNQVLLFREGSGAGVAFGGLTVKSKGHGYPLPSWRKL